MQQVGDCQDQAARELVVRSHPTSPFPGLLIFEPDELRALGKTAFDQDADETLAELKDVLKKHPDLSSDTSPQLLQAYDRRESTPPELLDLEQRLAQADASSLLPLIAEAEAWLAEHGDSEAAPQGWMLLGQAWYLAGEFGRANEAWSQVIERFPQHPLRHRAHYDMLDHAIWPEPPRPPLRKARLPGTADTGVSVPFPDARARNMESVQNDPRYRWSPSGIPFVVIPAGAFIMGSEPPGAPREQPLRRVTISRPFLLAAWPVTQSVWRRVYPEAWEGMESEGLAGDLPATGLSWNMATAFTLALRTMDGWRYRFPTEAEWELAARDGREGAPYPWGHEPLDETRCNYNLPRPVPVASYPPTDSGLFDMLGNTVEMVSDRWLLDAYSRTPYEVTDPRGPSPAEQPEDDHVTASSPCGSPFWKIHTRISWRTSAPANFANGIYSVRLACTIPD